MANRGAMAVLIAGVPAENPTLFLRVGLAVGDPAAWISVAEKSTVILRDVEIDRARVLGDADRYACPADFKPPGGLDPDRTTATAQAVAQCLRSLGVERVRTDRSLPFVFAWHVMQLGIALDYDSELGVLERRVKNVQQQAALARAQQVTEQAMQMACSLIARSQAQSDGTLRHDGAPLTSERVKSEIARNLLDQGFSMGHGAIVATTPDSADCHHGGVGPLHTGQPVIIDIFPRDEASRYWGDCTRTVVHGKPSAAVVAMHRAVLEAKAASIACLRAGRLASAVHQEAIDVLLEHQFRPSRGTVSDDPTIQHGTGHGVGLELHEPILLDEGGEAILAGEVFTVEPGLYGRRDGGVRVEDMLVVTETVATNLNQLHEGLDWS
ncbi:MAG: M24 family metallopeptidase [Pirellulales bacterium]|nr:M24 family metallopeptidase [Pirellulales bacterium]